MAMIAATTIRKFAPKGEQGHFAYTHVVLPLGESDHTRNPVYRRVVTAERREGHGRDGRAPGVSADDASQARAATTMAAVPVCKVGSMTGANFGE